MIKGVNKQVLEVTNTDSPYFERIIYFVRPESQSLGEERLHTEAEKLANSKARPPRQRLSPRQLMSSLVYSALGLGAGAGVMVIIQNIIK